MVTYTGNANPGLFDATYTYTNIDEYITIPYVTNSDSIICISIKKELIKKVFISDRVICFQDENNILLGELKKDSLKNRKNFRKIAKYVKSKLNISKLY